MGGYKVNSITVDADFMLLLACQEKREKTLVSKSVYLTENGKNAGRGMGWKERQQHPDAYIGYTAPNRSCNHASFGA
jgi:hypothetical protein